MEKIKILIADDETDFLSLASDFLTDAGYRVDCAESGLEGISLISQNQYDVCIVDIHMPQINGIKLLNYLSADDVNSNAVRYIVSGFIDDREKLRLESMGAQRFYSKPFEFPALIDDIKRDVGDPEFKGSVVSDHHKLIIDVAENVLFEQIGHGQRGNWFVKRNIRVPDYFFSRIPLFGEKVYGSIAVGIHSQFIYSLLQRMFDVESVLLNKNSASDYLGDICNLVAGRLKTILAQQGTTIKVGIPILHESTFHPVASPVVVQTFEIDSWQVMLEICLGEL